MVGCVLGQLAVEKATAAASAFSTAKKVELLELYPIYRYIRSILVIRCYVITSIRKSFCLVYRTFGYEKVYLQLCKMADTPFHIQGDDMY